MPRTRSSLPLLAIAVFCFALPAAAQHMSRPPAEQIWLAPRQSVPVLDFPAKGLILDIGGGGWGVIGQLKGKQVVAVDLRKREFEEAPGEPLIKIIMDARDLKFLDKTFDPATVSFAFMCLAPADHLLRSAKTAGFEVVGQRNDNGCFHLELGKAE